MLIAILVLAVVLTMLLAWDRMRRRGKRWRQLSEFPGDSPLPLIGNALELGFDADGATNKLLEIWKRHGKTSFRLSVGTEEWVMLCKPQDIAAIMGSTTELFKSPERNAAVRPFFGNSISTSDGDRWRIIRKLMAPSFSTKTLQSRLDVVNHHCLRLMKNLDELAGTGDVSMYRHLRSFMYDVLCESFWGIDSNSQNDADHRYLQDSGKVVTMITENYFSYWRNIWPLFPLTSSYKEMQKIIKTIKETSDEIIYKRRIKLDEMKEDLSGHKKTKIDTIPAKKIDSHCLLDTLLLKRLPCGKALPEAVINEEISFVGFTGHFTTSLTISHTLYCLAKYPEIQKRVLEEQRYIFSNDSLRKPTMQDIKEMKYLEAVIKETIRLIPTVPKIGRKLTQDLVMNDGRVIPSGTTVIIYYEALFVDEESFPDPYKFKPERFYDRDKNMHMYAFMPFGCGPRVCLGFRFAWVAMKATISSILRRFELSAGDIGTEPQFAYRIVTESKNGIHLKLKRRLLHDSIDAC